MSNDAAAYARAYVKKYGLRLVKIEPGSKAPSHPKWNEEGGYFSDEGEATSFWLQYPTWNMGVVLGPSRLCSLDVDNVPETKQILAEFGIDIDQLAQSYPTIQGNPSRFRVEFAVPEGVELSRHALSWPDMDAPEKSHVVFELRAGGVQDVFPPSIHPETGKPYIWLTKPNGHFPEIPERLLAIWKHWDIFAPQAKALCPWNPKPKGKQADPKYSQRYTAPVKETESVIDAFNAAHDIGVMLVQFGYEPVGNRWLSPHSGTKLAGVCRLDERRVFIHHASDPLGGEHPVSCFDLYCYYEHAGDVREAVKAAAKLLGMNRQAQPTRIPKDKPPQDAHVAADAGIENESLPPIEQLSDFEKEIRRLAQMNERDYEIIRKNKATELQIRASVMDSLVKQARQIEQTMEEPIVPIEQSSYYGLWNSLGLDMTKNGPVCNLNNAVTVLTKFHQLVGRIWYDEFSHRINSDLFHKESEWTDADTLQLTLAMQRDIGLIKMSSVQVREAVVLASRQAIRNPPREYCESLEWDGKPRIEQMLTYGWGCASTPYTEAVGRCWMVSMIARIYEPGCKVDTVPVFEGPQGLFKSTALSVIGGPWYAECNEPINNKDFYMILEGRLVVEIAEMHSFSVGEIRRVKGIISTRVDRYRAPYASTVEDHPRQAVLACTTNEDDWNRDPTGARRFWPVKCEAIDLNWLKEHRDQLFAEAVHVYKTRHIWHDVPPEYATREQNARRQVDAWEAAVYDYLIGMDKVTTRMVLERALMLDYTHQTQAASVRVNNILKVLGWETRLIRWRPDEVRVRGWVRTQKKREQGPVARPPMLPSDDSTALTEE